MNSENTAWSYYRRVPVVVQARKIESAVDTPGAKEGDYLVRDTRTDGVYVVAGDVFEDQFEPVVGPERT